MEDESNEDESKGLSPADHARELARKGIGGWIEGVGDRAMQSIVGSIVASTAVVAVIALLRAHWPIVAAGGVAAMVLFDSARRAIAAIRSARSALADVARATGGLEKEIRQLAAARPASPALPLASSVPKEEVPIYAFGGLKQGRGIGSIRSVLILEGIEQPTPRYHCRCTVDFFALVTNAEASPYELVVTGPGGAPRLAVLETDSVAKGSGLTEYRGTIETETMHQAITQTMKQLTPPYMTEPFAFCAVEIRLPSGEALRSHRTSGVFLDFECKGGEPARAFIVKIESSDL